MKISRRQAILATLFGASGVGLRAAATGLPAALLLNPRKALADPTTCVTPGKAQYIIFSTSYGGDPLNANVPGSYEDPKIVHPPDPAMAPASLTLSGKPYTAAKPWASLPQSVLDRTSFFHMATGTSVHPNLPLVLRLMGATNNPLAKNEMLPSLLAKATAACLGTVRAQPIAFGSDNPTEALSFDGAVMPIIPPIALRDTLTSAAGPLTDVQALRDQTMNQLYDIYKNVATPPQRQFIDQMVTSQNQVRQLEQGLLDKLSSIKDNTLPSQLTAAMVAIQMKLCPLISVHANFGGDNHGDANLQGEANATVASVKAIGDLMQSLSAAGLQDQVTFMTLNNFGRGILFGNTGGRPLHNADHQVSVCIGKPFRGGVIGGCAPFKNDYGATTINSSSGAGGDGGDIQVRDTLASFGKTVLAAVGGDPSVINSSTGKVVAGALA